MPVLQPRPQGPGRKRPGTLSYSRRTSACGGNLGTAYWTGALLGVPAGDTDRGGQRRLLHFVQ